MFFAEKKTKQKKKKKKKKKQKKTTTVKVRLKDESLKEGVDRGAGVRG